MSRMEKLYLEERKRRKRWSIRKLILVGATIASLAGGSAALAAVGPGDQPCVPGQHGNPAPGFKAPPCPGN